jgi:hypothetical protein
MTFLDERGRKGGIFSLDSTRTKVPHMTSYGKSKGSEEI